VGFTRHSLSPFTKHASICYSKIKAPTLVADTISPQTPTISRTNYLQSPQLFTSTKLIKMAAPTPSATQLNPNPDQVVSPLKRKNEDVFAVAEEDIQETTTYWEEWLACKQCAAHNKKPVISNADAVKSVSTKAPP
jgi:hypothetical protein